MGNAFWACYKGIAADHCWASQRSYREFGHRIDPLRTRPHYAPRHWVHPIHTAGLITSASIGGRVCRLPEVDADK